ncbi:MAG TPA: tRNA (adenosine(37)-N6)-dimethylallyltransferase MiaA [Beutenbergiaceae bacterium]|nr:tRNA (adenosine(37)-N6)-dimethylallyltransferase MiaA [Beutenbergiaceae bacterium]
MIEAPHGAVIAVVGPTATGKSDLALDLAEREPSEIVNADAMQLYRGMDIGTAKLPRAERRGIPHHQLDVLDVTEEASVAAYQRSARADIERIHAAGKRAILVGGSGLYVRAVLEHFEFPATDPEVRARLQQQADRIGPGLLHDELAQRDPEAAARIDRANTRRIVRALEVIELTGAPFTASLPDPTYVYPTVAIGIDVDAAALDARIDARAKDMFARGLVEETEALLGRGLAEGKTASRAVGYEQAIEVLAGRRTRAEAVEDVALATRQLARRQRKWFKRDDRITWIEHYETV